MRTPRSFLCSFIALLALVLLSGACAVDPAISVASGTGEPDADLEFAATADYLARAKSRTAQATSYRFESFTEVESSFLNMGSRNTPVMTGEVNGDRSRTFMDMASLMGPALSMTGMAVDQGDLTMTVVTDGGDAYINAPFFGVIADLTGLGNTGDGAWMNHVATGWGRVETGSFAANDVLAGFGGGGAGGTELLAVLDGAGEVLDGGQADVRGVTTNVAHANVSFFDLLEQSGQDLSAFNLGRGDEDMLRSFRANVAVYVDDDDLVRRIEFVADLGAIAGLDQSAAGLDMRMWQRLDFFDFGADISVWVPSESIDITDELKDLGGF